jgi:hypothetical protein
LKKQNNEKQCDKKRNENFVLFPDQNLNCNPLVICKRSQALFGYCCESSSGDQQLLWSL